ncbi:MAG: DnaJ domain-containing protein [Bdellovibrio sp.]
MTAQQKSKVWNLAIIFALCFVIPLITQAEEIAEKRSHYEILDVPPNATKGKIKQNYRKLAQKLHPDKSAQQDVEKNEAEFKKMKTAYEVLSDDFKRAQYDRFLSLSKDFKPDTQENAKEDATIEELEIAMHNLSKASSTSELINEINALARFHDLIYSDMKAFSLVFRSLNQLLSQHKFKDLSTVQTLFSMLESWEYWEYLTTTSIIGWENIHEAAIHSLILQGYSLREIISMLEDVKIMVDISAFTAFSHLVGEDPRSFPKYLIRKFKLREYTSTVIFDALFKAKAITNQKQFAETVSVLKVENKHLDFEHKLYQNLQGKLQYVLPFFEQLEFSEVKDLAYMVGDNPTEVLALTENILNIQSKHSRFTAEELTEVLSLIFKSNFRNKGQHIAFSGSDEEMFQYFNSHPGQNLEKFEEKVKKFSFETWQTDSYRSLARQYLLAPILKDDFIDILKQNKKVLDSSGFSAANWEKLAESLNIMGPVFKTKLFLPSFSKNKKSDFWSAQLPKPEFSSIPSDLPALGNDNGKMNDVLPALECKQIFKQ